MYDLLSWVFVGVGVLIGIVAFIYLLPLIRGEKKEKPLPDEKPLTKPVEDVIECPICGEKIGEGSRLFTKTYPAEPKDKVFVRGCSNCYDPKTGKRLN